MTRPLVLVVEPDREAATELAGLLFAEGLECTVASSGDLAWQSIVARRPDLILVPLAAPALEPFHRRLRDEYLGQPPLLVGVADPAALEPSAARPVFDAVLLRPLETSGVFAALIGGARPLAVVSLDIARMLELLKLSTLGGDLQASLDRLARRLALIFGVPRCAILATASERQWIGATRPGAPEEAWPALWRRCEQAVLVEAPLFTSSPRAETRLAVPIPSPGGQVIGAVLLAGDGAMLFADHAREALGDFAVRLGVELGWRSVHDRLVSERDHLRETSLLDPMLGILSRPALEQALTAELARTDEGQAPLVIAVLDVTGLRHINDCHGHLVGDAAIRHVANLARRAARPQDAVGRCGDDEIAMVFGATPMAAVTSILERLRRALESEPFQAEGAGPLLARVGIGVTEQAATDQDCGPMLARAARAATAAGRRGGTLVVADDTAPGAETRPHILLEGYQAGATLGGMYQIVHEISRGAMGVVYRAEDLGLSRPVALKMLRPDLVRDVDLVRRFRDEAAILAAIDHDNLVRVYSFIEDRDDVFFVMELVEGVSLDNHIAELAEQGQVVGKDRAATIITDVAGALDAMHHAGVMHRDVKPGNVVLDRTRDRPVLVDVGLARRLDERKAEAAGTPGYIAPESFRGDPESPATDVYGLAATAYALLTGHAPFGRSDDYREILQRQLDEVPAAPSSWRGDLTPAVDAILLRGLAVERDRRFASAGELARALELALEATAETTERATMVGWQAAPGPAGALTATEVALAPRGPDTRRTMPMESQAPRAPEPMTRGVVFRGVTRVLGVRTATAWIRTVERSDQELADALSLRTSPTSWLPAHLFHRLLTAVGASGRNAHTFARELGSDVLRHSFERFYPSSPESLSPTTTLRALDILWRRYHSWSELSVASSDERSATIVYQGGVDPAECAFAEGWLERVVELSGGGQAHVGHLECSSRGAARCQLIASWQ